MKDAGDAILRILAYLAWGAATAAMVLWLILRNARLHRQRTEDACPHCGYPKRGLPRAICPECGGDLNDPHAKPPSYPWWFELLLVPALLVLASLAAGIVLLLAMYFAEGSLLGR